MRQNPLPRSRTDERGVIAAFVAVYIDPTEPLLSRWIPLATGPFVMDPRLLTVMVAHFFYSRVLYVGPTRRRFSPTRVAARTMWVDVLFGAAMAILTEGVTSPAYPFFAFAVVAAGLRAGLHQALVITGASVGLYVVFLVLSTRGGSEVYIMRPVYLAITGYLVGFLGQQRQDLENEIRQFERTDRIVVRFGVFGGFDRAVVLVARRAQHRIRLRDQLSAQVISVHRAMSQGVGDPGQVSGRIVGVDYPAGVGERRRDLAIQLVILITRGAGENIGNEDAIAYRIVLGQSRTAEGIRRRDEPIQFIIAEPGGVV